MTKIQWTDETWNPITGCSKISSGCKNCYAEKMARRLKGMRLEQYKNGFEPSFHPGKLDKPANWKKPRMVFVCSMGDIFHDDIPLSDLESVFKVMNSLPRHTFQVLTKRPWWGRSLNVEWTDNIWYGVTVESQVNIDRIEELVESPAKVKFISCEPLLSSLDLDLDGIDWVIAGGETGHCHREMKEEWVLSIKDQCEKSSTPFFFKSWGGKRKNDNEINGVKYQEFPKVFHRNPIM